MRRRLLPAAAFLLFPLINPAGQPARVPSFAGAEGFGTLTPGGRGGRILFVDSLDDSGAGTLRAACEASGPRLVLFRVAGVIDLQTPVRIREPFLTIAGQSAPGDGICFRRHGLVVDTHDVVIRFIRSRPGDLSGQEVDALSVIGNGRNVVIDHCSASWSVDETLSPSGAISDVTVQWCLIAESLDDSVHRKGPHGNGSLVRASGGVSLHHNLWAHNRGRNPRLGDNYGTAPFPTLDVRNNVIYNPGRPSIVGDRLDVNYVGNLLRPGPDTRIPSGILSPTDTSSVSFFLEDNLVEGHPEWSSDPLQLFTRKTFEGRQLVKRATAPFPAPHVTTGPVSGLLVRVLRGVGATRPVRDDVDRRIVADVVNATGIIIDSQSQVGGWPDYRTEAPKPDTDADGMPDAWEQFTGLDPRSASDAWLDRNADGYPNIEEYLQALADGTAAAPPADRVGRPHGRELEDCAPRAAQESPQMLYRCLLRGLTRHRCRRLQNNESADQGMRPVRELHAVGLSEQRFPARSNKRRPPEGSEGSPLASVFSHSTPAALSAPWPAVSWLHARAAVR